MKNDALLLRQVHPSFVHGGEISSQVFKPSKEKLSISTYDGEIITAEDAFDHYTEILHNRSCGVVAVSKEECTSCGLSVLEDRIPYREHICISYGGKSGKEVDRTAVKLKRMAMDRGWLFGPKY